MNDRAEPIARFVTGTTYSISGTLIASDWFSFIDKHAAAFGVILGAMTFITNFIFQWLNHRAIKAKINNDT